MVESETIEKLSFKPLSTNSHTNWMSKAWRPRLARSLESNVESSTRTTFNRSWECEELKNKVERKYIVALEIWGIKRSDCTRANLGFYSFGLVLGFCVTRLMCRSTHYVCRSTHPWLCIDRHTKCVDRHIFHSLAKIISFSLGPLRPKCFGSSPLCVTL